MPPVPTSVTAALADVRAQGGLGLPPGLCAGGGLTLLRGSGPRPEVMSAVPRDCPAPAPASRAAMESAALLASAGQPHGRGASVELSTFRDPRCARSGLGVTPGEENRLVEHLRPSGSCEGGPCRVHPGLPGSAGTRPRGGRWRLSFLSQPHRPTQSGPAGPGVQRLPAARWGPVLVDSCCACAACQALAAPSRAGVTVPAGHQALGFHLLFTALCLEDGQVGPGGHCRGLRTGLKSQLYGCEPARPGARVSVSPSAHSCLGRSTGCVGGQLRAVPTRVGALVPLPAWGREHGAPRCQIAESFVWRPPVCHDEASSWMALRS